MKSQGRASQVLQYFACAIEAGQPVDPRVMKYLAHSFRRFLDDTKHDIAKALGLKRDKAGNPSGMPRKRRSTPDAKVEMALRYEEALKAEHSCSRRKAKPDKGAKSPSECAISNVAQEYAVSVQTVRDVVAAVKKKKIEAASLTGEIVN